MRIEDDVDRIIISLSRQRYALSDLVADLTYDGLAEAFDWGANMGREIVE